MSLAEIMVFSLLLIMLTGGMYLLLVAGLRHVQQGQVYQTVQQQALIGIKALTSEISNARDDNNYLIYGPPTPSSIVMLSGFQPYPAPQDHFVYPDAPTGNDYPVVWQKWVGFYLGNATNGTRQLIKVEDPITGRAPSFPCYFCQQLTIPSCLDVSFPAYQTPTYPAAGAIMPVPTRPTAVPAGGNWGNARVVARNIYDLSFEPTNQIVPAGVTITLYAQDNTGSDRVNGTLIQRDTMVRYRVSAWLSN